MLFELKITGSNQERRRMEKDDMVSLIYIISVITKH